MNFTFEQFVHYGVHHGGNIVNGMPWSFQFYGHAVSHENDHRYIITGKTSGKSVNFHRGERLLVNSDGSITVSTRAPLQN